MASKKKKRSKAQVKLGQHGPAAHWLDLTPAQREQTKAYIKAGLQGYERSDGMAIPGARRIYKGLAARDGFDLRHIERWPASKLRTARARIQAVATLTSRPFEVLIPRTKKQKQSARAFTGQREKKQKEFISQVRDTKIDRVKFKNNKVIEERTLKSGAVKQVKQRFLWRDYLDGDPMPITFAQMWRITERMLPDMPDKYYGRSTYFTLTTAQYGPIGQPVLKKRLQETLADYHARYDASVGHQDFGEQVIGWTMIGTGAEADRYIIESDARKIRARQRKKLRFTGVSQRCPTRDKKNRQCVRNKGHKGKHKFAE